MPLRGKKPRPECRSNGGQRGDAPNGLEFRLDGHTVPDRSEHVHGDPRQEGPGDPQSSRALVSVSFCQWVRTKEDAMSKRFIFLMLSVGGCLGCGAEGA